MFVRWTQRPLREFNNGTGVVRHTATVLESYRQDGKKCQRNHGPLGSITAYKGVLPSTDTFWKSVLTALDRLDITAEQRRKLEADVAKRVHLGDVA